MVTTSMSKRRQKAGDETTVRERILDAAFRAFRKSGYATTSTLEIATRARVSKRELYELVGNKQEMLIACISERAKRLDVPADLPMLRDRETLAGCGKIVLSQQFLGGFELCGGFRASEA
jgi:AcrR family transcriptional regulator